VVATFRGLEGRECFNKPLILCALQEGQSSFSLEEFVKKKIRTSTPEFPSKGQKQDA